MSSFELPPPGTPEEIVEFDIRSQELKSLLESLVSNERWSRWFMERNPRNIVPLEEPLIPRYRSRYRASGLSTIIPIEFQAKSPDIIHDSEMGQATFDLILKQEQLAKTGGLLSRIVKDSVQDVFRLEGRHREHRYPGRGPKPITKEARLYGMFKSENVWRMQAKQPRHIFVYDASGNLTEASIAYNENLSDSPIYASEVLVYRAEEGNVRTALMAIQAAKSELAKFLTDQSSKS